MIATRVVGRFLRAFSTTIDGCKTVPELIDTLKTMGSLNAEHLSSLEKKSLELVSGNLRETSMLLLTLNAFGCDLDPVLSRMVKPSGMGESFTIDVHSRDSDILFRALAECGVYSDLARSLLNNFENASTSREIVNFACGYAKFTKSGTLVDASILDVALRKIREFGLENFGDSELIEIAKHLSIFKMEDPILDEICSALKTSFDKMTLASLIDLVHSVYTCQAAVEALETRLGQEAVDGMSNQDLVAIVSIYGKLRRHDLLIMDKIMVSIRKEINTFTLDQLTKILISLSRTGYTNLAFVRLFARAIFTHIDQDSILDPFTITNLYTGFSRFKYKDEKLYKLLSGIVAKEEVLAEFKVHDLVAIVHAYSKVHIVDKRLFSIIENVVTKSRDLNTQLAVKLLNAFARLGHCNVQAHNFILECINLGELDTSLDAQKLRLSVLKLGLYFPELDGTAASGDALPRIMWRSCSIPRVRRFQHVRKRKWTW